MSSPSWNARRPGLPDMMSLWRVGFDPACAPASKPGDCSLRLANVRIGHKLVIGFACVLAIFAVASAAIFAALARVESAEAANVAANAVLVDLEQLAAARYDQSQTARGYILIRVERHASLYAAATKLFEQTLAKTRSDALASPDSASAVDALTKLADAAANWQKEVGDPEVQLTRDPATAGQAIEIAKSPGSSALMQKFREALEKAREVVGASLKSSQTAQASALVFVKNAQIVGGVVAMIGSLLVGWGLYRGIAIPISGMTNAMRKLAAGETDLDVPAAGRSDELGLMAAAVENFRQAAIEKRRMDAEAEAARSLLEAERATRDRREADQRAEAEQAVTSLGAGLARLAAKDLTYRMSSDIPDAYRKLRTDFNTAIAQLEEAMAGVTGRTGAIHSGSQEISAAADDLSRRTEQQAASLEETAGGARRDHRDGEKAAEGADHAREVVAAADERRRKERRRGAQGGRRDGRHRQIVAADQPDHRRDRRDRVPDQSARAERRGRGGAGRRRRAAASPSSPPKCARSPSARPKRPRRSRD